MDEQAATRVATALSVLLTDQGRTVLRHPDRLRAGLADLLGADRTATAPCVDALIGLAESGQVAALSEQDPNLVAVTESIHRQRPETDRAAATWAARTVHQLLHPAPLDSTRLGPAGEGRTQLITAGAAVHVPVPVPAVRRRGPLLLAAVAALVVVAGASAGITYLSTRPTTGAAAEMGRVSAVPAATVTQVELVTTTAVVEKLIPTTKIVVTAVDLAASYRNEICESAQTALTAARRSMSAWATASSEDRATAQATDRALVGAAATLDKLVAQADRGSGRADTVVTVTTGLLSVALQDLAAAVRTGGTAQYSSEAWNRAFLRQDWLEDGLTMVCNEFPESSTVRANSATIRKACGTVGTRLSSADSALRAWVASPGTGTAAAYRSQASELHRLLSDGRWSQPILFSSPFGRSTSQLAWWSYNLGEGAAVNNPTNPPSDWVSGWNAARDAVRAACT